MDEESSSVWFWNGGKKIYFKPLLENSSLHVSALFISYFALARARESWREVIAFQSTAKFVNNTLEKAVDVVWGGGGVARHISETAEACD